MSDDLSVPMAAAADNSTNESQQAILFAVLKDLSIPHHLAGVIGSAARWTQKRLIIVLVSSFFNERKSGSDTKTTISHSQSWEEIQNLLTFVYVQATNVAQQLDNVLMDIDVLLKGVDDAQLPDGVLVDGFDTLYCVHSDQDQDEECFPPPHLLPSISKVIWLTSDEISHSATIHPISTPPHPDAPSLYPVVVVGGTFDHLHAGHKILLSMAAWITSEKIIVGVTDDALLTRKTYKEVLEDLPTRMAKVTSFLALFRPGLIYDVVPIDDVYGPTRWDPNIQALVVSHETLSGAASVTSYRAEKSLPALQIFTIDVISPTSSKLDHEDMEMLKQTKMSSTFIRDWIVKRRRQS